MTDTEINILQAAQTVFLKKGLDGASMANIAEEAKISRPALHYYHRTKQALFHAILMDVIESIVTRVEDIVKHDTSLPLLVKASKIIDFYHQILLEKPFLPRFIITEIQRDPEAFHTALWEKHEKVVEILSNLQNLHAEEWLLDLPPKAALAHFFTTLYGLLFFPFLSKPLLNATVFRDDPDAFNEFIAGRKDIILRMLAALFKPAAAKSAALAISAAGAGGNLAGALFSDIAEVA